MKTREEILTKHLHSALSKKQFKDVLEAMEEYAVEFAEEAIRNFAKVHLPNEGKKINSL